jgi:hypothetical protein
VTSIDDLKLFVTAPHGVIIGPDGGLNAIIRFDLLNKKVQVFLLPQSSSNTNLNTATFELNLLTLKVNIICSEKRSVGMVNESSIIIGYCGH